jgi:hypothetical protein
MPGMIEIAPEKPGLVPGIMIDNEHQSFVSGWTSHLAVSGLTPVIATGFLP